MRKSFALAFMVGVFATNTPAQTDTCRPKFGMNFTRLWDQNREIPFVDVMKMSMFWLTTNSMNVPGGQNRADTGVRDSIPADSNGYPLQLPYSVAGQETTQVVYTRMLTFQEIPYPGGEYICLYDGDGAITFGDDARIVSQTPGRIVLDVTPSMLGIRLTITRSTFGNQIRNIRVLMPGTESSYQTQPFAQAFLQKISPFSPLRFVFWQFVINTEEGQWSNRRRPQYYTQSSYYGFPIGRLGIAYEYIIKLCNITKKDAWIHVPHTADSNFVVEMAKMFRDSLDPTLKIYLEYSNEVWNFNFPVNLWVGNNGPSNLNHPQKTAYFVKRVFDIWTDVFGSQMSSRVVRVAACQLTNPWVGQQMMGYLGPGGADALAPAAYYVLRPEDYDSLEARGASTTASDVARMIRGWFPNFATFFRDNDQTARQYGLRLIFYEGGGEIRPRNPQNPSAQAIYAFQRDTTVYNVTQEWFSLIRSNTSADLFTYFHLAGSFQNELYGALESIYQQTSPRYQAILDNTCTLTTGVEREEGLPENFVLLQNYPNPFNPTTRFEFSVSDPGLVSLKIYDVLGREVATVLNEVLGPGTFRRVWDATGLSSGVYVYRLTA
ncbi:MAG: T9SS type A sorting domain-containing protein, partial [Bacteroidota bacterium]